MLTMREMRYTALMHATPTPTRHIRLQIATAPPNNTLDVRRGEHPLVDHLLIMVM